MSLTSIASARPGAFVPAISHGTAAAADATVTTQADGRFVVEPARPDDSLFALFRTADACLGRPVERIGGILSNIVGKLFAFGPTLAEAAPVAIASDPVGHGTLQADAADAEDDPFPDANTLRALAALSKVRIRQVDADSATWKISSKRNTPVIANLHHSFREAIDESPQTALLIARALERIRNIVIAPQKSLEARFGTVDFPAYKADTRTLYLPQRFAGKVHPGSLIQAAYQIGSAPSAPQRLQPADLRECAANLGDLATKAEKCLGSGAPAPCNEALAAATKLGSRNIQLRTDVMSGAPSMTFPFAARDDTPGFALTYDVQRDGPVARLTPTLIRERGVDRPMSLREALLARFYFVTDSAVHHLRTESLRDLEAVHLAEMLPWPLLAATCPPAARLLDPETTSTPPATAPSRIEL